MAIRRDITLKRLNTSGKIPQPNQLRIAEFAFNTADNKLFIKNAANQIKDLTNLSSVTGGILPIAFGGTGSNTKNFVDLSTSQTIGGVKAFTSGEVLLNNTYSNTLSFGGIYVQNPTFANRSLGTKIVIRQGLSSDSVDIALGTSGNTLWYSIPRAVDYQSHSFFAGTTEVFKIQGDGNVTALGFINCKSFRLSNLNTAPASATSPGTIGEIRFTSDYIYACTATNTWKRAALSTW